MVCWTKDEDHSWSLLSLSTKRARKDLSLFFDEGWLRGEGGCGSWVHRHTLKSTPPQDVQRSMVWPLLACMVLLSLPPLPLPSETAGKQNQTIAQTLSSSSFSLSPAAPFWKDPPLFLLPSFPPSVSRSLRAEATTLQPELRTHTTVAQRTEKRGRVFLLPPIRGPLLLSYPPSSAFHSRSKEGGQWCGERGERESERRG